MAAMPSILSAFGEDGLRSPIRAGSVSDDLARETVANASGSSKRLNSIEFHDAFRRNRFGDVLEKPQTGRRGCAFGKERLFSRGGNTRADLPGLAGQFDRPDCTARLGIHGSQRGSRP